MSLEGAVAAHRFGLGAQAGEIATASADPKGWLKSQIGTEAEQPQGANLMKGGQLVAEGEQYRKARAEAKRAQSKEDPVQVFMQSRLPMYRAEMAARFALGFSTARPFAERLVWFWSNHFTVSAQNPRALTFVGAFEREAIRPYIHRRFEDMLLAVASHPAMLLYLDNAQSIGPDSLAGQLTGKGLNENLGRELMELYSLGVDGGYTQADVIALAKLLTGWSVDPASESGFNYYPRRHEPGDVTLRGRTYPPTLKGGIAAVRELAHDPHTAHHIAVKFATYFVADDPPPASVARLETVFNKTGGDLKALAEAAVDDPAAWVAQPAKLRSPVEYVTAAYRLLGLPKGANAEQQVLAAMGTCRNMGEFPMNASSPKGWPLTSDAWSGPDAILSRIEWAKQVGGRMPPGFDAMAAAEQGMGPLLQPSTRTVMARAETPGDALAFLFPALNSSGDRHDGF